jgi:hypothetical protein
MTQRNGVASVEIPPHDITSVRVTDRGEFVQIRAHDDRESIAVTLMLPLEAVDDLRERLDEVADDR